MLSRPAILAGIETISFPLSVLVAMSGVFFDKGFFGNPLALTASPQWFIIIMNMIIGMKVGASISFMCIAMMGGGTHD